MKSTITGAITLIIVGIFGYIILSMVQLERKSQWEKPCEEYEKYALSNIPARCYKYFTGEEK